MFGRLRTTCPVDAAAKKWLEERLRWLSEEFDSSAFTDKPVVLPTPEFFPDPYDGSKRSVRALLDRVCGYMGVLPSLVALRIFSEARSLWFVNEQGQALPNGAAGLYEEGTDKFLIRLEGSELGDAMGLVGTMAHELAHVLLLGEGRTTLEEYDGGLLRISLSLELEVRSQYGGSEFRGAAQHALHRFSVRTEPARINLCCFVQEQSAGSAGFFPKFSKTARDRQVVLRQLKKSCPVHWPEFGLGRFAPGYSQLDQP